VIAAGDGSEMNSVLFPGAVNGFNGIELGLNGAGTLEGSTYLVFDTINIDTIFTKFARQGNSLYASEIYYNGVLTESNINVTQCGSQHHEIIVREDE